MGFDYLLQLWNTINDEAAKRRPTSPGENVIVRAIRDYLRQDVGQLSLIAKMLNPTAFIGTVMPDFKNKVKLYKDQIPLFNRYQIENQIETAFRVKSACPLAVPLLSM